MMKLLKIEWLKVRRYRAFIILAGFFLLSVFGINYIVDSQISNLGAMAGEAGPDGAMLTGALLGQPFIFPNVWQTVTYLSSYLLFIPGLIVILLTANEYSFKTHRQGIIDGFSRSQFMEAKIALMVAIAVCVTLFVMLLGWFFGLAGATSFSLRNIEYVGYFFIQALSYMSVALVLVLFFKRSGISIGIYFLYISIIKNLLALLLNYKVHEGLGDFLPVKSADLLIPAPTNIGQALNFNPADPTQMLIASVAWIGLCLWFCIYRFRTSDL